MPPVRWFVIGVVCGVAGLAAAVFIISVIVEWRFSKEQVS